MRRPWTYVSYLVGVLVIALVAGLVLGVVTVRRSFPDTSGTVRLVGLDAGVEVVRDEHGIPQIYADTSEDLFFAQGYVQAQDRFFEMDFRRHVTSGRLAELVGDAALETDTFVRTLGWRRVAEREVSKLAPTTRSFLRAYSEGVNAYIAGKSSDELSLEYTVLGLTGPDYSPEPWTPVDSVAWLKAMAWDLRSNMTDEITRVLATETLEPEQIAELYPDYPYDIHDPIVEPAPSTTGARSAPDPGAAPTESPERRPVRAAASPDALVNIRDAAARLPQLLGTGDGIGSNSWVVSGERSSTGEPLLANDPHLAPSMPGAWYQMGLHCREVKESCPFDVSGFTFAGMPGVVIGHNDRIAWGVTTMYPDVTDLYLERVAGDRYRHGNDWRPVRKRTERFEVAGEDTPIEITVRSTHHGPILSDLDEHLATVGAQAPVDEQGEAQRTAGGDFEVALRWTALDPGTTMDAVFALDKAQDWKEFRAAAKLFDVPSQNLVYADVDGHIGYQAPGRIPIRGRGDGRWPVPGWDPAYEWEGMIPFRELPSVLDPESGYIVTANNAVTGPSYPHLLGTGYAAGYRSTRIEELIEGAGTLSVDDMTEMQTDAYSLNAEQIVPLLLPIETGNDYYDDGRELLEDWDYVQSADSGAAAYFNVVWKNILKRTFHDQLPKDAWPDGGERWFEVMRPLLANPTSHWWDDITTEDERENRDWILREALRDARDEMTMLQSLDPSRWRWGHLHELTLTNATLGESGIGPVEAMFNRGPYEVGGGGGLVNANAWDATEGYQVTAVPSMRMVVSLDDPDDSRWISLTGASGHAYHDHYTDQSELWARGETLPWPHSREAVEAGEDETLVLEPTS